MTLENKKLLLKDLCARLLYGVIVHTEIGDGHLCSINQTLFGIEYGININSVKRYFNGGNCEIKPYLRLISSMTEEEKEELKQKFSFELGEDAEQVMYHFIGVNHSSEMIDWLNEHHFDYRGLIPMGLALEALEGMYKTE